MQQFNCITGSSFSDVCINTYGSLDFYVKLLNDNGLTPNDMPNSNQSIVWDEQFNKNATILKSLQSNGINLATFGGYITPPTKKPIMNTYKDVFSVSHVSTVDETVITFTELQGNELVQLHLELKILLSTQYTFNATTGVITLQNTTAFKGQTLTALYKKTITS
jgi:hypothetical protein